MLGAVKRSTSLAHRRGEGGGRLNGVLDGNCHRRIHEPGAGSADGNATAVILFRSAALNAFLWLDEEAMREHE